tara:strand:+ start:208 stop:573 length:366 start_codon:yes stop_codon:yes gene_type:complete
MNDLKIPNLNNKSKQYLFKNKIPLTRKPRIKLLKESFYMIVIAILIFSINYAIPGKLNLFYKFFSNLNKSLIDFIKIIGYFYEIFLVLFILSSLFIALILLIGALYRIYKSFKRKSKKINF